MTPASILVLGVVIAIVAGAIYSVIKSHRSGKCSCGCSNCCNNCKGCEKCIEIKE